MITSTTQMMIQTGGCGKNLLGLREHETVLGTQVGDYGDFPQKG